MRTLSLGWVALLHCFATATLAVAQHKNAVLAKLEAIRNEAFQEKVYLHTDRTNYLAGETIWFAAYCTDGYQHRLSSMSKVTYVDLIDSQGSTVAQHAIDLSNGTGNGSIYLPTTLSSGYYELRGYTRWMQNFGVDFFFHQQLAIINPFMPPAIATTSLAKPSAHSSLADGTAPTFGAADVQQPGIAMRLTLTEEAAIVNIDASPPYLNITVTMLVQVRGQVIVIEQLELTGGKAQAAVDKKVLPEGIGVVTVFDQDLNLRCERWFFTAPGKLLDIRSTGAKAMYRKREKVQLTLATAEAARLSLSVIRKDELPTPARITMPHFLLVDSDLPGQTEIRRPDDHANKWLYDTINIPQRTRARWSILSQKKPHVEFLPELRGPLIQARVENTQGQPVPGISVFLASPDSVAQLSTGITNKDGIAHLQPGHLRGTRTWVLQLNNHADSLLRIRLLDNFCKTVRPSSLPELVLDPKLEQAILQRSIAMQSQHVFFEKELAFAKASLAPSHDFYGLPDEHYLLDDYTRFPVMEEVMREYVSGVWVRKRKDGFHFLVHDDLNKVVMQETPLMLVDGVPFFDEDEIMTFDPLKIKSLDVVNRKYFLGAHSFPGIVSLKTYSGDLAGLALNQRAVTTNFEALQHERLFYAPRHHGTTPADHLPDLRTTLLWQPGINTPSGKEQTIEFFTSDLSGEYEVIIQGISASGLPGYHSFSFSVED